LLFVLRIRKFSLLARQFQVFGVALKLIFYLYSDKLVGRKSSTQRNIRAKWLVKTLIDLGPTFIKMGQALSTRPDLIPWEYLEELGKLQDGVPPFSPEEAIALIESELDNSIYTIYRDFQPVPLAAASLGQVHKARLHTGEEVVVKVQRPGLEKLFNLDFQVLHRLVNFANRFLPWTRKYRLAEIHQEFFQLLYQEIDYIQEGKNADRFRENFQTDSRIAVPKVYWPYTTKKVLTLEYLPGIKIDDRQSLEARNIDKSQIIQLGIGCYLKQLLQDGFFQSDPHPGNMAVSENGKIIFYDFGTMAEVKSLARDQMVKTFFAVLRKDTDEVVETLIYMGLLEPVGDMTPVKRLVAFLLEEFREKPIDIQAFDRIGSEIYLMFEQQPFRLPPQMTFILKSLTTLDGIARTLDPQYNLLAAARPFVKSLAIGKGSGNILGVFAGQARDFLKDKLKDKFQQPFQVSQGKDSRAEVLIKRLEERIETGQLQVRVRSLQSDRALQKIHLAIKCLIYACLSGFTLLAGTLLWVHSHQNWAIVAFSFSAFWFLILLRYLINLSIRERLDKLASK